jgi:serine/threonine-protein kinase
MADDRLYAGRVIAGYRLEGRVGEGGFAHVLKASRVSDGTPVALKLLREEHHGQRRRERQILREGRLLQSLSHPRILSCLGVGRAGAWAYLALPWIDGEALSSVLERGRLSRKLALDCGFQVLEALEYLHRKGIVHQDVKPDNLVLDAQGNCTLVDFGLAQTRKDALLERAAGGVAKIVGSVSYRAPEQADPHGEVDAKADVYAFAVTLHRLITRKLPKSGAPHAALEADLAGALAPCLSVDPAARPTAQALRRQLHALA